MTSGYDIEETTCIAESNSGKALLMQNEDCKEFEDEDRPGKCWVPKSQITEDSEVYQVGDSGTLSVTEWYAEQKGWG